MSPLRRVKCFELFKDLSLAMPSTCWHRAWPPVGLLNIYLIAWVQLAEGGKRSH